MPLRGKPIVPINKPQRKRLPRDRFAGLPLAPAVRVKDAAALEEARKIGYCEWCALDLPLQASHSKSKGSGGGDTRANLTGICVYCHTAHHAGKEPTTAQLLTVAMMREAVIAAGGTRRIIGKHLGLNRDGRLKSDIPNAGQEPTPTPQAANAEREDAGGTEAPAFSSPTLRAQQGDWVFVVRPSPDDPDCGRRLAKILKWLLRQANARCVDMRQV